MSWFTKTGDFSASVPFYTTRKHGPHGTSGSYSCSLWMTLLFFFVIWTNVLLWGTYSLYLLAGLVF